MRDLLRRLEFVELRGDPLVEDDHVMLAGKCLVGPIRVGDQFSILIDRDGRSVPVEFTVLDINFYGSLVWELEPAMAGELVMVGDASGLRLGGATLRGERIDCEFNELCRSAESVVGTGERGSAVPGSAVPGGCE
jgi:hypothetical protein